MLWSFNVNLSICLGPIYLMLEHTIDFLSKSDMLLWNWFEVQALWSRTFSSTGSPVSNLLLDADFPLGWSHASVQLTLRSSNFLSNTSIIVVTVHFDIVLMLASRGTSLTKFDLWCGLISLHFPSVSSTSCFHLGLSGFVIGHQIIAIII